MKLSKKGIAAAKLEAKRTARHKEAYGLLREVEVYTLTNNIELGHYSTTGTPESLSKRIELFLSSI
jgi:hypothetical protein